MRKVILIALMQLCVLVTYAQEKEEKESKPATPKTKLELFFDKSGKMMKRDFQRIGEVKGVDFEILTITDLGDNSEISGLRIKGSTGGTYSRTYIAFLDSEEMDSFLKAINYMLDNVANTAPPENHVEYNYKSKSDFTATIFNSSGVFSSKKKWSILFELDDYASSGFNFAVEDLPKIKDVIGLAKEKLSK